MRSAAATLLCLLGFCAGAAPAAAADLKVCVFYDGGTNAQGFPVGERAAVMVRNLLGHFREASVDMAPVGDYRRTGLARCDRAAYVGAFFDAKLPEAFLADAAEYQRPFLWMNYNIWQLERRLGTEKFREAWGFAYRRMEKQPPEQRGRIPHFYRHFTYKDATFRKVALLTPEGRLLAHPELVVVESHSAAVLSEAIHSGSGARLPYVLRKGDNFYVADNPTSVIDERDRYLIFADLLFDFLKLPPRSEKRYAALRLEDVHPVYDLRALYASIELLRKRKAPFAITMIPRYIGPGAPAGGVDATQDRRFLQAMRYALDHGGSILVHGYEHQLPVDLGCGITFTGEGYEFWDMCNDRPLPFDSEPFVQERIDKAKKILQDAAIPYAGWVTPHYMASPLAFGVIHRNFGRVMQRMTYVLHGRPPTPANTLDQIFPYTIYNDYYGMHVWPENLGYVPLPQHGGTPRHVEEMIEVARLTKVVRDGWASFFWHPPIARTPLGLRSLERLVDGIRAEGYEFVSLQELRARGE
jgi:uncharacterized protein YdaL